MKNRKMKNIADGITNTYKVYLQCGFKITHMHADGEFKSLGRKMTAIYTTLNCAYKRNMSLKLIASSRPLKSASDPPDPIFPSNKYIIL